MENLILEYLSDFIIFYHAMFDSCYDHMVNKHMNRQWRPPPGSTTNGLWHYRIFLRVDAGLQGQVQKFLAVSPGWCLNETLCKDLEIYTIYSIKTSCERHLKTSERHNWPKMVQILPVLPTLRCGCWALSPCCFSATRCSTCWTWLAELSFQAEKHLDPNKTILRDPNGLKKCEGLPTSPTGVLFFFDVIWFWNSLYFQQSQMYFFDLLCHILNFDGFSSS